MATWLNDPIALSLPIHFDASYLNQTMRTTPGPAPVISNEVPTPGSTQAPPLVLISVDVES